MIKNKFGELVFSESDLIDLLMSGQPVPSLIVDDSVKIDNTLLDNPVNFLNATNNELSVLDFDVRNQSNWYMPEEYNDLDIAEYVLGLCQTPEQLQRAGKELLLYQEKNLFDLLKYLKYLVDTMKQNGIIWGVGRGSSVASYVLYLIGVHRVDSIYYDLDPEEFLR